MNNIIIDPIILPHPEETKLAEEFEEYLDRILEYNYELDEDNFNFYISRKISELLVTEYNYPSYDVINQTLQNTGLLGEYEPKDIVYTIERILQCTSIEDRFDIEEILIDHFNTLPENVFDKRNQNYKEEIVRITFLMILLDENLSFTSYLASLPYGVDTIDVKGTLIDIEGIGNNSEFPLKPYSGKIRTFSRLSNVYNILDPIELWRNSDTVIKYEFALRVYLFQTYPEYHNADKWVFGHSFFDNLGKYGFVNQESKIKSLLRAISETITNNNNRDTHALRTNSSGDSPQKMRNLDKAWRRDIDYEFHLHYWETGSNTYEFSNVVTHEDMRIYK